MEQKKYKYQKQLDELIALGCQLPELYAPNNLKACRFAYSDTTRQSHIPQYMANPKRMLQDVAKGKASTSLLSLSCFTDANKAESFYANLQKAFKNISATIGDSVSEGILRNDDGQKTESANNGHFDFYEFEGCDLNSSFEITKHLINDENDKRI
ncbi:MAG: hypothetical protein IJQ04_03485 [Prevotella sp.]|nr:hypothetical protein [Prevotella sp.]